MFCSKCGTSLPDNARFCPNCGNDMSQFIQQTFVPAPEAPAAPVIPEAPAQTFTPAPEAPAAPVVPETPAQTFTPAPEAPVAPVVPEAPAAPEVPSMGIPTPTYTSSFDAAPEAPAQTFTPAPAAPAQTFAPAPEAPAQTFTPAPEAPAAPVVPEAPAAPEAPSMGIPTPTYTSSFDAAPEAPDAPVVPEAPAQTVAPEAPVMTAPAAPAADVNTTGLPMPGGMFVNTNAAPTAPAQQVPAADTPVEPTIPQQPVESVIPTEPVQPQPYAMPAAGAPAQQNYAMPEGTPQQPVYNAPAPVTAKPKKKGKAGLIIGISAAAVVGGGAATGYFVFHDDITRMVMGSSGYAQMVSHSAFSDMEKETDTAGKILARVIRSSRASVSANMTPTGTLPEGTAAYMATPMNVIANVSAMVPEGTAVSSSANINITAGSLLTGSLPAGASEILDLINSLNITSKMANGETDIVSLGISDSNGNIGSLEVYRTADGDLIAALPGVTDKTITISKQTVESASGGNGKDTVFSESEAKRILDEILKIYYENYDGAAITFTDGVSMSGALKGADADVDLSVTGTETKIVFTGEQMIAVSKKVAEFLVNDEYVKNYAKEAFGIDEAKLAEMIKVKDDADASKLPTVTISHIVDVHNNVLATSVSVKMAESSSEYVLNKIEKGSDKYIAADVTGTDGNHYVVKAASHKTAEKDGNAVIAVSKSGKNEFDISFDCAFTGYTNEEWLGTKVPVGTFTLKLSDPEAFAAQFNKSTSPSGSTMQAAGPSLGSIDAAKFVDEIKNAVITLSSSADGNKYSASFTLSAGNIGSIYVKADAETTSDNVIPPSSSNNIDLNDSSAIQALSTDAMKWLRNVVKRSEMLDQMVGTSLDNIIGGYDPDAVIDPEPITDPEPDVDPPVIVDDYEPEPYEMNNIAQDLSEQVEYMLGYSGKLNSYAYTEAADLVAVFESDENGKWKASAAYADKRETYTGVISDKFWNEVVERLDSISGEDYDMKGLTVGYYFSGMKYVGDLVMLKSRYNVDFDLYGLPDAENVRIGTYAGWCASGEYAGEQGYFADYNGKTMYVGTFCVSTGMELVNPEEADPYNYLGIEGDWEVVEDTTGTYNEENGLDIRITEFEIVLGEKVYSLSFREDSDPVIADIYDFDDFDDPIGAIEFGEDGSSAVITDVTTDDTLRIRKIDYAAFAAPYIGEIDGRPELEDIAGVWVTTSLDEERYLAVSSSGLIAPYETNQSDYSILLCAGCIIDIFNDVDGALDSLPIGYMLISEDGQKMLINYRGSEVPLVLKKNEEATKPPYYGYWHVRDIGDFDGDPDTTLNVTDYFAVFTGGDWLEVYIIFNKQGDNNDEMFRLYPEYNDPSNSREIIFEFDKDADTITMTEEKENGEKSTVVFERS